MRKTLTAFVLLLLCPVAVAGADENEEYASDASTPAEGSAQPAAYTTGGSSTSESAAVVGPPGCWPNC